MTDDSGIERNRFLSRRIKASHFGWRKALQKSQHKEIAQPQIDKWLI
jgi:hypothetical protein